MWCMASKDRYSNETKYFRHRRALGHEKPVHTDIEMEGCHCFLFYVGKKTTPSKLVVLSNCCLMITDENCEWHFRMTSLNTFRKKCSAFWWLIFGFSSSFLVFKTITQLSSVACHWDQLFRSMRRFGFFDQCHYLLMDQAFEKAKNQKKFPACPKTFQISIFVLSRDNFMGPILRIRCMF